MSLIVSLTSLIQASALSLTLKISPINLAVSYTSSSNAPVGEYWCTATTGIPSFLNESAFSVSWMITKSTPSCSNSSADTLYEYALKSLAFGYNSVVHVYK